MRFFPNSILTLSVLVATNLVNAQTQCLKGFATALAPLSTIPAIQTFCSLRYPLPAQTSTTTLTATITNTVSATSITTITVAATYSRAQAPTKREAEPALLEARQTPAAVLSLIKSAANAISSVCSCFQTPKTVQATRTTTVTASVTSTVATATATITVSNECTNLFVCGGNSGFCGTNDICTCFQATTDGFCSSAINSNGACNSDSDCANGDLCVFNTCAGNACIPSNDPTCAFERAPARLFRRAPATSVWSNLRGRYVTI